MGLGAKGVSWGFGDGVVSHDAGLNSGVASLTWQDPYDGLHAMFAKGVFYTKIPLKPSNFSTFSNMFTFTGGNQGMYMDRSGFLVNSQTNVPRLEFTSQTVGTNLFLATTDLGILGSSWGKNLCSVDAGYVTAPFMNGGFGVRMKPSGSGFHFISQTISFVSGIQYTLSVYAKSTGVPSIQVFMPAAPFTTAAYGFFNLVSGTVQATNNVSGSSITNVGGGWYRCSITQTATATVASGIQLVASCDPAFSNASFTADYTNTLDLYGPQIEIGSTPTVYAVGGATSPSYANSPISCLGVIEEGPRTNLALQSSDFSTTWLNSGLAATPVVVNTAISPDGTQNADKIVEASGGTFHLVRQDVTIAANTLHTFSIWIKQAGRLFCRVQFTDTTESSGAFIDMNAYAGTSNAVSAIGTATNAFSSITSYPNGWYRVQLSCIIDVASVTGRIQILTASALGTVNYAGDGTSGLFLYGAQLEAGAFATSYIPTTTVGVARTADFNSATSTGLVDTSKGTTVFVGDFEVGSGRDQTRKYMVNMGTTLSIPLEGLPAGGVVFTSAVNDGTTEFGSGVNFTPTFGLQQKFASNYGSGTMITYTNGTNVNNTSVFDGVMNDGGAINFGVRSDNANHIFGHVYSADYHNFKFPAATLARITK